MIKKHMIQQMVKKWRGFFFFFFRKPKILDDAPM